MGSKSSKERASVGLVCFSSDEADLRRKGLTVTDGSQGGNSRQEAGGRN